MGGKAGPTMAGTAAVTIPAAELLDALTRHGGFTYDPHTGHMLNAGDREGWVISRAGTERHVTRDDFESTLSRVLADWGEELAGGALLGGWYSPERDVFMVELSDVFDVDRVTALVIAAERDQEAAYNLATGDTVSVPTWDDQ